MYQEDETWDVYCEMLDHKYTKARVMPPWLHRFIASGCQGREGLKLDSNDYLHWTCCRMVACQIGFEQIYVWVQVAKKLEVW